MYISSVYLTPSTLTMGVCSVSACVITWLFSSCLFLFSRTQQPIFPLAFSLRLHKPVNIGRRIFSCPKLPQYQYLSMITNSQGKWAEICKEKLKPESSLWCEIGHHKGINDGSFQHNCLIMPGRWGTALTRTHCATSPDSPQQKANQCDSLFSSEWEGEWKKENGEWRRG